MVASRTRKLNAVWVQNEDRIVYVQKELKCLMAHHKFRANRPQRSRWASQNSSRRKGSNTHSRREHDFLSFRCIGGFSEVLPDLRESGGDEILLLIVSVFGTSIGRLGSLDGCGTNSGHRAPSHSHTPLSACASWLLLVYHSQPAKSGKPHWSST